MLEALATLKLGLRSEGVWSGVSGTRDHRGLWSPATSRSWSSLSLEVLPSSLSGHVRRSEVNSMRDVIDGNRRGGASWNSMREVMVGSCLWINGVMTGINSH